MGKGVNGLLKKYIEDVHSEELKYKRNTGKQSKIGIDYQAFTHYLEKENVPSNVDSLFKAIYTYEETYNTKEHIPFHQHITFLWSNVPETHELRDLDATNNLEIISCKAMIKNITDIRVELKEAVYICQDCGKKVPVEIQDNTMSKIPSMCQRCGCKKMMLGKDESIYRDYRYVKLEEPLELRKGGTTREFKGYIQNYLASPFHNIKAGDVVDVTGVFKVEERKRKGRPDGFEFMINIHNISPVDDIFEDNRISENDVLEIKQLSQTPNIFELLYKSLAPEVYGYNTVKKGMVLQLFEGNRPSDDTFKTESMDRWNIHILLIGDPGIGKSQLIQAMKKRAPKNITISGTNTSQAGLTVSTVKDELTGTWTMEAGATVLADTGVLCIDEYDKLNSSAQKSLNEPMEQLSVSSAKAGLVQTMTARTSILAGANPKYSKFDIYKPYREQLDIPESNLSRFDLIFVLEDDIDESKDSDLAYALLNRDFIIDESELIPLDLFKKYITWVKANCFPVLNDEAKGLLRDFYVNTRQEAKDSNDGKPITARDLKALERLTIARAKCENRSEATANDALDAIGIYTEALKSIGLNPSTAGERYGVMSENEKSVISMVEELIEGTMDYDEGVLSAESLQHLEIECGMLCDERGISSDGIFEIAYENVRNSMRK